MTANRHLAILCAITLVVVVAAGFATLQRRALTVDPPPAARMFPNLAERFGDIAEVTVARATDHAFKTVTMRRDGEAWGVVERDNYPVDGNILRRLLVALDQLKVLEAKTRDPKRFERIDLRDLSTPGARGGQVVVRDSQGEVVFDAIIGKRRANLAGGPARVYVRRSGEQQTWLAEGDLDLRTGPVDWLNREITNIPADDTARARLTAPDGAVLDIVHDDKLTTKFRFTNIPDTVTLVSEYAAKNIAAVLEFNTFKDVRKAAGLVFTDTGQAEFWTKNGLYTRVDFARDGEKFWTRFAFRAGDGADAAARTLAGQLTARNAGWAYLLPDVRIQRLRDTRQSVSMPDKKTGARQ
ncbi:MAG: DUF4340 domain-containing protein [Pseudomonadota bacterium]|nr:DUF4340 domain-containing protein [Pseudomonadota bacterium]